MSDDLQQSAQRRHVAVIFSDLEGYSPWVEQEDPERVAAVLDRIKAHAVSIFERYGGIVNQFVGDEVMGLFGADVAREDDVQRAIDAALALHAFVDDELQAPGLRLHTGIAYGLVLVRKQDAREGLYSVIGHAVNTAARLRSRAAAAEILVDANAWALAHPFFDGESLGDVVLKGVSRRGEVVKIARRHTRMRFASVLARGLQPFVGRERELALLREAARRVEQGAFASVAVSAPPGMGKSRLLYELRRQLEDSAMQAAIAWCADDGVQAPLTPWRDLFFACNFTWPDEDPAPRPGEDQLSAVAKRVAMSLTASLAARPTLLVIEDWHWSDGPSRRVLRELIAAAPPGLLLVVSYRAEEIEFPLPSFGMLLQLQPLTPADVEQIISVFGGITAREHRAIAERCGGVPLFAEEMCRAARENQHGVLPDLDRSSNIAALPSTLVATIAARIDRLPQREKWALQRLSVLGESFRAALAQAVLAPELNVPRTLAALARKQLVRRRRSAGGQHLHAFSHKLVQEAAYAMLPLPERREYHRRAAAALAATYAGDETATIAFHLSMAEEHENAAGALEAAAKQAKAAYALYEAARLYERALTHVDALAPTDAHKIWRCKIAMKLASVSLYNARRRHRDALQTSLLHIEAMGELRLAFQCHVWLGSFGFSLGEHADAIAHHTRSAQLLARAPADAVMQAVTQLNLGMSLCMATDYALAEPLLEASLPGLETVPARHEVHPAVGGGYAMALACLGMIAGDRGDFVHAYATLQRACEIIEQQGLKALTASVLIIRTFVAVWRQDWPLCRSLGAWIKDIGDRVEGGFYSAYGHGLGGIGQYFEDGDPAGIDKLQATARWCEDHAIYLGFSIVLGALAEMLLDAGRDEEAEQAARRCLELADGRSREALGKCAALRVLARLRIRRGQRPDAELDMATESARTKASPRELALCEAVGAGVKGMR